jgi:prefoldin subunit 5
MVSIAALTEHYKQAFTAEQAKVLVEGAVAIEHDLVNREDFSKLTATVERLADRMGGLGERMEELAGAQKRTEERMDSLGERMEELAGAQKRTEERMDSLGERMEELAGAQKQTESRMDRLAVRMDALAESQQSMQRTFERFMVRTEEQFTSVRTEMREGYDRLEQKTDRLEQKHDSFEKKMDASFADVRKQLGGLSLSVGMGLEAYALDKIPRLLEMHCGFKTETVCPETFTDGTRAEEIDVVVRGSIAGQPAVVVCEVKTSISQTEVRDFFGRVDRVRSRLGCDDVRVLFFGYRAAAETHGMIEEAGGWLALPAGILRINRQAG